MARISITKFENSLTEFLINALSDKYGDAKSYSYKYNNLKVFMDPIKISTPHFFVAIGISEACFAISDGKKIEGGLGIEDGYVKRWSERINIQKELKKYWKMTEESVEIEKEKQKQNQSLAKIRLNTEPQNSDLGVDMTGTGIIQKDNIKQLREQEHEKIVRELRLKNTNNLKNQA
jgi:hypothetical protein